MKANSSEEIHLTTDESAENTSQAFPPFQQPQPVSIAPIVVGMSTGAIGICANAFVLVVLIFARRHHGSHVNTLITNQSAMDLAACIFLTIGFGMMLPGTPQFDFGLGDVGNNLVCYLFQTKTLAVVCKNAGIIGLIIIDRR